MKRSASGVSVRSLTVTNPIGAGGDGTLIGNALMPVRWPPKRVGEAGMSSSQPPVSIKRM